GCMRLMSEEILKLDESPSQIRNPKSQIGPVQSEFSDFGFEMGFRPISKFCLLILALLVLPSCRQHMANDPSYRTFQESGFFPNGSSARPLPEGTVPQEREQSAHLVKGVVNGQPSSSFPFPVTLDVLERGRQRFDIFCTPCHDHLGTGEG